MAAGVNTKRGGIGRLIRLPEETAAYTRAALISIPVAAGLAGVAYFASQLTVSTGTILLFARAEWSFWALRLELTLALGGVAARVPLGARHDQPVLSPRLASPIVPTTPIFPAVATFAGVLLV